MKGGTRRTSNKSQPSVIQGFGLKASHTVVSATSRGNTTPALLYTTHVQQHMHLESNVRPPQIYLKKIITHFCHAFVIK